jgi:hypothetical protein
MQSKRCPMCGGLGWVTDCNDLTKPGPRMVEFIQCFHPECDISGQPIASLNFKGVQFQHVSRHPAEGWVMSVSDPVEVPA